MPDILDAAQKQINDAANKLTPPAAAGSAPPPADPTPPTPPPQPDPTPAPPPAGGPAAPPAPALAPEPAKPPEPVASEPTPEESAFVDKLIHETNPVSEPPPEPPKPPEPLAQGATPSAAEGPPPTPPKKKGTGRGAMIAAILLLLFALPMGVFFVSQQKQLAEVRSRAAIAEPCKSCVGTKCTTLLNPPKCSHTLDECTSNPDSCAPKSTPRPTAKPAATSTPRPAATATPKPPGVTGPAPTPAPGGGGSSSLCHYVNTGTSVSADNCNGYTFRKLVFQCNGPLSLSSTQRCEDKGIHPGFESIVEDQTGATSVNLGSVPNCKSKQADLIVVGRPAGDTLTGDELPGTPRVANYVKADGNQSGCGGGGEPTPTTPPQVLQCRAISIYKDGAKVTDYATLKAGDTVVLAVKGDNATKGRFRVNGAPPTFEESTGTNANGEFTLPFTIPGDVPNNSITIEAEVFQNGVWK